MEIHIRIKDIGEEAVSVGNAEIWAEDCNNENEKILAKVITACVHTTLSIMSGLSQSLFVPPKDKQKGESN